MHVLGHCGARARERRACSQGRSCRLEEAGERFRSRREGDYQTRYEGEREDWETSSTGFLCDRVGGA
eukprot:481648-Pyramimonas_sp.AAC.1